MALTPSDLEKVAELVKSMAGGQPPAAGAPAGSGLPSWVAPPGQAAGPMNPIGFSIPVEIEVNGQYGPVKVTLDLAFGPEEWTKAPQIVETLMQQGYKVKSWDPNRAKGGGNWGGNRGGYGGGNGGGYGGGQQGGWVSQNGGRRW